MKIKVLKDTYASGKYLKGGKTHDVKAEDAKTLIRMGKAVDPSEKDNKEKE